MFSDVDSTLIYASEHRESLDERGMFLHDFTKLIALAEHTHTPIAWQLSTQFQRTNPILHGCVIRNQNTTQPR